MSKECKELLEERWLEREWQREKLNKEYIGKLQSNRSLLRQGQVLAAYESNILTEPAVSGEFN